LGAVKLDTGPNFGGGADAPFSPGRLGIFNVGKLLVFTMVPCVCAGSPKFITILSDNRQVNFLGFEVLPSFFIIWEISYFDNYERKRKLQHLVLSLALGSSLSCPPRYLLWQLKPHQVVLLYWQP
jgi:hypothetical protein